MTDPNTELLKRAATLLRPLLDELVFVGGCVTGLLITDTAAARVRSTFDVDALVEISSYGEYVDLAERLKVLGLTEDHTEDAPICRWKAGDLKIDVMPTAEEILGFSNEWYKEAIANAKPTKLHSDLVIQTITAPYFIATKIGAFLGRGNGDYFASHDIEDLVAVVDGREELVEELSSSSRGVREYIAAWTAEVLNQPAFLDALPGLLAPDAASQDRVAIVNARLRRIAG